MGFSLPPDNEIFIALEKIPFFEKQMLFQGERFPNVVVAKDGSIIATLWKENCVRRRSIDGGYLWENEVIIGPVINGGGLTLDENSGDLITFVEKEHPPSTIKCYKSRDIGKTFYLFEIHILPDRTWLFRFYLVIYQFHTDPMFFLYPCFCYILW